MSTNNSRRETFPRTDKLPTQSAKFWVKEKDRYLRQLLISDIEAITGRSLVVYHSHLSQQISLGDSDDLSEILDGIETKEIDLLINTPGGYVDACEKFITVLRNRLNNYRVIVPSMAKSCGTVIAISSSNIILGVNSELGPIDPQFGGIPCDIIASDPNGDHALKELAKQAVNRMRIMAHNYLKSGMMSDKEDKDIQEVVLQLSSSDSYSSHGAVIDHKEAHSLGLAVKYLEPEDELWRKVWLLHLMYQHDIDTNKIGKIVEGAKNSVSKSLPQ